MRKNLFILAAIIIVLEVVSWTIGITSMVPDMAWYDGLAKSPLNPPSWAFGVVWPALYALMGFALWKIWLTAQQTGKSPRLAYVLFAAQMVVNWAWSYVFFTFQMTGAAVAVIAGLIILVLATIYAFWHMSRAAALALIPYLLWISFALHLSWYVWAHN